ncbi:hypothetical protein, partial [Aeromonas veronii]
AIAAGKDYQNGKTD